MKFPFILIDEISDAAKERFRLHMDSGRSGWHRRWTESIWRRHQHPANADLSGWAKPEDRRRRLIHFRDEYGVDGDAFVLRNVYLSLNLTLPADDIAEYWQIVHEQLTTGGWSVLQKHAIGEDWRHGDLFVRARRFRCHPYDELLRNSPPVSYQHLEITVQSAKNGLPPDIDRKPWQWFYEVGLRKVPPKGQPSVIEPEQIIEYLPAQVELGCGASTEAGIPALSTLHQIYGVSRSDFSFVFRASDDALLTLFSEPERKYMEMSAIYRACLLAEPTPFYKTLDELWQRGIFVGPIVTNNFDCLCADLGLEEYSMRRYDVDPVACHRMPGIAFDPNARTLLAIGIHADRRLTQLRAREAGLRIVFIDPECYVAPDGARIPYPLEAPQTGDLLARVRAGDAMARLRSALPRG